MVYTVTSSERNNESASTQETKALLYLMSFRQDSNQIYYFIVDFFNDVTGADQAGSCGWDVQSKASKNLNQSSVGRYLVTLYKNYLSGFRFNSYILFTNGFSDAILINKELSEFTITNFTDVARTKIAHFLKDEALSKSYIDSNCITDENIEDFLTKVIFVVANTEKSNYIKKIIKVNPEILPSEEYLERIFDQIRATQTDKKNVNTENITINHFSEFANYKKHLTSHEIKMLVLSRLIHKNGINHTPLCFYPLLDGLKEIEKKELIEDCHDRMARVICDINNSSYYWNLFEEIYKNVSSNPNISVNEIYERLDPQKVNNIQFLDIISTKFFISLVKDGIQYD